MMDPVFQLALRTFLILLWLMAIAHKMRDMPRFAATVSDYRLVPALLAGPAAVCVTMLECCVLLALLLVPQHPAGPLGSAVLLLAYGAAISVNLARGRRDIDCGCFGPLARQQLDGWLVWRNLLLAALSLCCLLSAGSRELLWLDYFSTMAAVVVLAGLHQIVSMLIANINAVDRLRH